MNLFLFKPDEYQRLYNCSTYSTEQIPLERRQHLFIGFFFLIFGIICEILYIPCMIAIRKHTDSTCYRFMFYIAITDMLSLLICAILTGIFAIIGAVYCTAPRFIYISGAFGLALWVSESTAEVLLAINRCVQIISNRLANFLFQTWRTYVWLLLASVYGMYMLIFTKPILFTGLYVSWFNNPHVGYVDEADEMTYRNEVQSLHNFLFLIALTGSYLLFSLMFNFTDTQLPIEHANENIPRKKIFIQVALISSVNGISAIIWTLMKFVAPNELMIYVGQFLWILAHGVPPFIYLFLNKTVRLEVSTMLYRAGKINSPAANVVVHHHHQNALTKNEELPATSGGSKPKARNKKKFQRQASFSAPSSPTKHWVDGSSEASSSETFQTPSAQQSPQLKSPAAKLSPYHVKTNSGNASSSPRRLSLMMSPRTFNSKEYSHYREMEDKMTFMAFWAYVLLSAKSKILIDLWVTGDATFDHDWADHYFKQFEKFVEAMPKESHEYKQIREVLMKIEKKEFILFGEDKVAVRDVATAIRNIKGNYSKMTDLLLGSNGKFGRVMVDFITYRLSEVYLLWRDAKQELIDTILEGVTVGLNKNIIRFFCEIELAYTALGNTWQIIEKTGKKQFMKNANEIKQLMTDLHNIRDSIQHRISYTQMHEIFEFILKKELLMLFPKQLEDILSEMNKIAKIEGSKCKDEDVEAIYIFYSVTCATMEIEEAQQLLNEIDKQSRTKVDVDLIKHVGNALELVRANFMKN
ncbi:hypothetical protein niasHS_002951 [Heterodera schachtii]|uniref:Gustatory receptor n=1 Tax=Heterodera schachtii TaxID=97005 RepID=A0ABD2K9D7_HETSC